MDVPAEPRPEPRQEPRKGIAPELLVSQVRNTAPFLFASPPVSRHLKLLHDFTPHELSHAEYFELCLAAHHATVATFVPTDVDVHIRYKLWAPGLPDPTLERMATFVLESREWDFSPVSTRWVRAPESGQLLSGHNGEWFGTAVAAYGALRRRLPALAAEVAGAVLRELQREAALYDEFRRARDGLGTLMAATTIAHNLGDLDRVIDLWGLGDEDTLKQACYKAGHQPLPNASLFHAGELNKAQMAVENHRHFALRKPRALRRNADFLMPIPPFLDDWGSRLGRHPGLAPEEAGEIAETLIEGWMRLNPDDGDAPGPVGYARALAGLIGAFPGGLRELSNYMPARSARALKSGRLHMQIGIDRRRFESLWARRGLV